MPIKCKLIDAENFNDRQSGDIWYAPWLVEDDFIHPAISPEYLRDWKDKRPPIFVRLPNGHDFCPDMRWGGGNDRYGLKANGWTVEGEMPNITVSPSINSSQGSPTGYHGWLQNGILTDDLEGRKY